MIGGTDMQIVVVKAPGILNGVLKAIFRIR